MSKAINETSVKTVSLDSADVQQTCGIIMPIAGMGDHYPESHWGDVKTIINDAIKLAGFSPRLVSESDDARVIQSSIVNNVYNDPIIVCDVSGKNANVMFELGMRLAFDKPVVIVVDRDTGFSFDTAPIEHLVYRRDLRHSTVEEFKTKLAAKIKSTFEKSKDKANGSFLSNFGQFKVAEINDKEISSSELLIQISKDLNSLKNQNTSIGRNQFGKISIRKIPPVQNPDTKMFEFNNEESAYDFYKKVESKFAPWVAQVHQEENEVIVILSNLGKSPVEYENISETLNEMYSAINS